MKNLLLFLVMLTITPFVNADSIGGDSVYSWPGNYRGWGVVDTVSETGSLLNGAINVGDSIQVWLKYDTTDLSTMHIDARIGDYDFISVDGEMITTAGDTDTVTFLSNGDSMFSDASYSFLQLTFTGSLLGDGLPTTEMLARADNIKFGVSQYLSPASFSIIGDGLDSYIPSVPVPAAAWLFMSGLLGLVAVSRRRA